MKKSLGNKTIVVTRAVGQAEPLIHLLQDLGANVISVPTFEISPVSSWQACDAALQRLDSFDWLIFTSANGVKYFIDRLKDNALDVDRLSQKKIAAVGEKTAGYLQTLKIKVDLIPAEFRAEGLIESFKKQNLSSQKILIIRPEKTRDILKVALEALRHTVEEIAVYRNQPVAIDTSVINGQQPNVLTFLSPSAVKNFVKAFGIKKVNGWVEGGCLIAAIGKITGQAVKNANFKTHILPKKYTIENLVKEISEYYK